MSTCTKCGCSAGECECEDGPCFDTVDSLAAEKKAAKLRQQRAEAAKKPRTTAAGRWHKHEQGCLTCKKGAGSFCATGRALYHLMLHVAGPGKEKKRS